MLVDAEGRDKNGGAGQFTHFNRHGVAGRTERRCAVQGLAQCGMVPAALVREVVDIAAPGRQQVRQEARESRQQAVAGRVVSVEQVGLDPGEQLTQLENSQEVSPGGATGQFVLMDCCRDVRGRIVKRQQMHVVAAFAQAIGPSYGMYASRRAQQRDSQ